MSSPAFLRRKAKESVDIVAKLSEGLVSFIEVCSEQL